LARYVYDAWGNHKIIADEENVPLAKANPFRYRGYFYDEETGLYYLNTRYYDPTTGRFISQDSVEYAENEVINGLNLYAYCGNNPVMRVDPNGTDWWSNFCNWWGNVWSAVGRFLGGAVLTVAGFGMALTAGLASIFSPGFTAFAQIGLTIGMYGVAMVGSVFSSDVKHDMDIINWNPFNADEAAVLQSKHFSFYHGVSVIRFDGKRSGTFGIMLLSRNTYDTNTVKHEWGHIPQLLILGPVKYGLFIGLPSALKLGLQDDGLYYKQSWESAADFFGGAQSRINYADVTWEDKLRGLNYLLMAWMFPFIG
ncbi:MAG: RHS repeat-associated core domain-containing protein, partial [Roseburia sp.]|nr:RHS repeat-associated core domain-containing protein [Roseburia sp.]